MKKIKKEKVITLIIILAVIILAFFILTKKPIGTEDEVARCIGENSILYTRLGCHFCEVQEEMFGDNYKDLNVIDCFFEQGKCEGITATPTWRIEEEDYVGVQSIEKLKELTGC
jgi:hypothetical protein